jgi:hypothetical protein
MSKEIYKKIKKFYDPHRNMRPFDGKPQFNNPNIEKEMNNITCEDVDNVIISKNKLIYNFMSDRILYNDIENDYIYIVNCAIYDNVVKMMNKKKVFVVEITMWKDYDYIVIATKSEPSDVKIYFHRDIQFYKIVMEYTEFLKNSFKEIQFNLCKKVYGDNFDDVVNQINRKRNRDEDDDDNFDDEIKKII